MSDNRINDLTLQPGSIGRKTGFQVTRTPRRGANGLEDPEDFFLSDDEFESQDISNTSPAKRLSVRYELEKGIKKDVNPANDVLSRLATPDKKDSSHGVSKIVAEISQNMFAESDEDKDNEDEDIDEVIKKAEKIGTPIKVVRRTLTSIDGSPGVKSSITEHTSLQSMRREVLNGARLTKSIALNKTNDSMFKPQPITNASNNEEKIQELTSSENESNYSNALNSDSNRNERTTAIEEQPLKVASVESASITVEQVENSGSNERQIETVELDLERKEVPELVEKRILQSSNEPKTDISEKEPQSLSEAVESTFEKAQILPADDLETSPEIATKAMSEKPELPSVKPTVTSKTPQKFKYKEVSDADLLKELNKKGTSPITPRTPRIRRSPKKSNLSESKDVSHLVSSESEDEFDSSEIKSQVTKPAIKSTPSKSLAKQTSSKQPKPTASKPAITKKPTKQTKKTVQPASPVRRSTRTRVPPVASWKNEKIVYKSEKINGVIVKSVTNVQHVESTPAPKPKTIKRKPSVIDLSQSPGPTSKVVTKKAKKVLPVATKSAKVDTTRKSKTTKDQKQPDLSMKKRTSSKKSAPEPASKRRKQKSTHDKPIADENSELEMSSYNEGDENPKTSWQKREDGALTLSMFEGPGTEKQVERTVAFAPNCYKNVTLIKSEDEHFKVGTLFDQDSEFCGGGIIELPPGSKKAVKSNHDTYFIFYVICGEIEVTLSRNTFVVTEGCSFEIPMGNYYQFINTSNQVARMMFVQSKYVVIGHQSGAADDDDSSDETLDSDDE